MHQTVSRYTTDNRTESILVEVYNSISQSYTRRSGEEQVQTYLGNVKKTLAEARKSTGIAFMCFRPNRREGSSRQVSSSGAPGGSRGNGGNAEGGEQMRNSDSGASLSNAEMAASSSRATTPTPRQPRPPRRPRDRSVGRRA